MYIYKKKKEEEEGRRRRQEMLLDKMQKKKRKKNVDEVTRSIKGWRFSAMYWKSDRCFRGAIDLHGMGIGVICGSTGKVEFQGEDIKQRVGAIFERGRQKNRQTDK